MEKPPSVKSTRRARAVFPEGKLSDAYSQNTLLAHLSELVGKDHAPQPREDHTQPVISGPPTPSSPPIPSFLARGMWAKRSLGAAGRMLHGTFFCPRADKNLKVYSVSKDQEQSLIIVSVPVHKELGVFPFSHSKLYTMAFLHIKQTS